VKQTLESTRGEEGKKKKMEGNISSQLGLQEKNKRRIFSPFFLRSWPKRERVAVDSSNFGGGEKKGKIQAIKTPRSRREVCRVR